MVRNSLVPPSLVSGFYSVEWIESIDLLPMRI